MPTSQEMQDIVKQWRQDKVDKLIMANDTLKIHLGGLVAALSQPEEYMMLDVSKYPDYWCPLCLFRGNAPEEVKHATVCPFELAKNAFVVLKDIEGD